MRGVAWSGLIDICPTLSWHHGPLGQGGVGVGPLRLPWQQGGPWGLGSGEAEQGWLSVVLNASR